MFGKKEEIILSSEELTKNIEKIETIRQAIRDERYNNLIKFILNNSKLNYDESRLVIDYGEIVLEYVKAIEPARYKQKYDELKKPKENKED